MKMLIFPTFCLMFMIGCDFVTPTSDKKRTAIEIQKFMDDYADMLKNKMEEVGNLYYDSGIVFSGHGYNDFIQLDTIKSMYRRRKNMTYFKWEDIKVDPLKE